MTHAKPIGYLVPEFPNQTHAFFWRELKAIEDSGVPVVIFSTRRPSVGACPHNFAEDATARTTYLFPSRVGAVARYLVAHPRAVAQALAYVGGLSETKLSRRAMLTGLIAPATELVLHAQRAGISHVHIHSCANAAHVGALANILGNLDYSLTLHGDLQVYGTDHGAKMARARFVNSVTAPLQDALREQIDPDGRFPLIWMGVDTELFKPDPKMRATRPADRLEVVSVARITHGKGHRFFLRAMAQLRAEGIDIHYRMAGAGPERDNIEAEIARLDLGGQTELLGAIGEDEVLRLLQSADVLALTSVMKGEAAPVAVMEAMACGLPAICSIIGGTPDMIKDGTDGFLVAQEDVGAIARATRSIARDPALRARMGQAARDTALKLFDHRVNARALYNEIAQSYVDER